MPCQLRALVKTEGTAEASRKVPGYQIGRQGTGDGRTAAPAAAYLRYGHRDLCCIFPAMIRNMWADSSR